MYNNSINQTYRYLLQTKEGKGFSEAEIKIILPQILTSLNFFHSQNQSHGAISLDTIVNNNQIILLPNQNYNFDPQKDIYDLGVAIIELLTAQSFYQIFNNEEAWDDYCTVSDQLLDIINKMIAPLPERFNSVNEVLSSLNNQNNYHTAPTIVNSDYTSPSINSQPNYAQNQTINLSKNNSPTIVAYPNNEQNNTINQSYNQVNLTKNKQLNWRWILLGSLGIIGILSAIAFPSFLSQANKGKEAFAKIHISSMVENQVNSYEEKGKFENNLQALQIGINSETDNYKYEVKLLDENKAIATATPQKKGLRSYLGVTFISDDNIIDGICATKETSLIAPQTPDLTNSNFQCASDSILISDVNNIPVPDQFIPRPSPEQAVIDYYGTINQQNYQKGWELLTPELRNNSNSHPEGFNSYLDWWTQVNYVDVLNTNLVDQTPNNSAVLTNLTYRLKSGRIVNQTLKFNFIWEPDRKQWLVNKVERQ